MRGPHGQKFVWALAHTAPHGSGASRFACRRIGSMMIWWWRLVMLCSASVCLSVCLFVCLLSTSRKNYWRDLHENFTTEYRCILWTRKKLIKFRKSWPASRCGSRNFLNDSLTLRERAFSNNLTHITGKADRIFIFLSKMHLWTRFALAEVCALQVLSYTWTKQILLFS